MKSRLMNIPFNKPAIFKESYAEIFNSFRSGCHSGGGPYTKICQEWFKKNIPGISNAYLSTSCTHALEAAAILLDLSDGDEVIVPSFTFVSTALSFFMHGANIRFCDIRPDTLNINEKLLEDHISEKTKAIVVVHYAGIACEMDAITKIANRYNLTIIEDNAHGLFGKYKGLSLGSIGNLSTQSFHETKNISCGEGGALFIRDENFIERSQIIFDKGTNRINFLNGSVDKYSWVDKGSSYILSDLLASLLYVQIKNYSKIQNKRKTLWNNYYNELYDWSLEKNIKLPTVPSYCEQSYHMFYMILPSKNDRNRLIYYLKEKGITATFHYNPLEISEMGEKIKLNNQKICPVSKIISLCIIRLPLYYNLKVDEQKVIINALKSFNI